MLLTHVILQKKKCFVNFLGLLLQLRNKSFTQYIRQNYLCLTFDHLLKYKIFLKKSFVLIFTDDKHT